MRERMVKDFQSIDNDGTGELTATELNARTAGLMQRLDQDGDGSVVINEIRRGSNRNSGDRRNGNKSRKGRQSN